jgi:putative ABC transport system permease protein
METLRLDLRLVLRMLGKRPGFTLIVTLTLALGIGANTAIFSVVNAVVLKPLPFKQPDRLLHAWETQGRGVRYQEGTDARFITVRPGSYHDWKAMNRSFEKMTAYRWSQAMLGVGAGTELLWANNVTADFFETLGAPALLGRTFATNDYGPNAPRVVILSHELWQTRFGGSPDVIGRAIPLDREGVTVIGVMPAGFYPTLLNPPQIWLPLWFDAGAQTNRTSWGLTTIARLKPGVTIEQAASEMDTIADRLAQAYPQHYRNMGVVLVPVDSQLLGSKRGLFSLLLGAVGVVLLIACVNVAGLLSARAIERAKEFAVRAALGASRVRLVRQLLSESMLLAGLGGLLGLLLARLAIRPILTLLPAEARVPRLNEAQLDGTALLFTLALSLLTGVLFGLAPALKAARADLNETLKEGGRGNARGESGRRAGDALVIAEVALSVALLVGAGLLMNSFLRVLRTEPGFKTDNLLALRVRAPHYRYGKFETGGKNPARVRLFEQLEARLAALPGVASVAYTANLPMRHGANPWGFHIDGREPPPETPQGRAAMSGKPGVYHHGDASIQRVSPDYFRTLGLRLLRGRLLDERDRADAPGVTVINETLARQYFTHEDPIGKRVVVDMTSYYPELTIVGVVADFKLHALDEPDFPEMFWALAQWPNPDGWLVISAGGDSSALSSAAQREINNFDRELAIEEVVTMRAAVAASLWRYRFSAALLGLLAALALVLAMAGLYGVLSYSVTQRAHEIGLRMALGAQKGDMLRLIIRQGLTPVCVGVLIGLIAALLMRRLIASFLYGVTAVDPPTYVGVALLLVIVALIACFIPARRAVRIDPIVTLRHSG